MTFTLPAYRRPVRVVVLRVWMPDRPGALGLVASRIGAVRGDVTGIDILERGGGSVVDELVVELPDDVTDDLLVREVSQVDGVAVERVVEPGAVHIPDPRLDVLDLAAALVAATTAEELLELVVTSTREVFAADWAAVTSNSARLMAAAGNDVPPPAWLNVFTQGVQETHGRAAGPDGGSDALCAPLNESAAALVLGRDGSTFRARERRQLASIAAIADARLFELSARTSTETQAVI